MSGPVTIETLRRVALVGARVSAGHRLEETLQAVAEGVVECLGFGCVAVNYVLDSGDLQVVAVAGPDEARRVLDRQVTPRALFDTLLSRTEPRGPVRLLPHQAWPASADAHLVSWIPDLGVGDGPEHWHPEDALFATLEAADGTLVGVLSLDLPPGGMRPDDLLCELIGVFAVQAGVAIANTRLTEELLAERERLRLERSRLAKSEAALRFTFAASKGGMATLRLDPDDLGAFRTVNDAFCRLVGYRHDQLREIRWQDLVPDDERPEVVEHLRAMAAGRPVDDLPECRVRRGDGTVVWAGIMASLIEGDPARQRFVLIQAEDITARKSRETVLEAQANEDHLTGLSNRRWLLAHLAEVVRRARRSGRPGALLYCDLDRFKQINDRFGHTAGDLALQEVADRLRGEVRTGDVVARLGGDEFVVVAEDLAVDDAEGLVARIRWSLSRPLAGLPVTASISIGSARIDGSAQDPAELLHAADLAMYVDKGRTRVDAGPVA